MDLGIAGRVALVTAASQGIGRAIAAELAAEGCRVVIAARGREALESARTELADAHGAEVHAIPADVSDVDDLKRLVAATQEVCGPVDILVTNSGGPPRGAPTSHDAGTWQSAYELLLRSVVELTGAVVGGMVDRGWGRILAVTSLAVRQPADGLVLSNSLRAGVTGYLRTLANEVAPHGVTVNSILPGFTATDRLDELFEDAEDPAAARAAVAAGIPARRMGEPAEIAAMAAFLVSQRASYVTAQAVTVDGGAVRGLL